MKIKDYFTFFKNYIFGREVVNYGMASLVKDFCHWPKWLIFPFEINHGWYLKNEPRECDIKGLSPIILVYNSRQKKEWERVSKKPCLVLGSPFINFRRKNNIKKDSDSRGTLAFPLHSGTTDLSVYNENKYARDLFNLPSNFKPVTICLHYDDMRMGRDKKFINMGFEVISIGHRHDKDFCSKFYEVIRKFKYITSNAPGTITLYSVDMNIPFFIYGEKPIIESKENNLINKRDSSINDYVDDIFRVTPSNDLNISKKQKEFVNFESGVNNSISEKELYKVCMLFFIFKILPRAAFRFLILPFFVIIKIARNNRRIFL